MYVRAEREIEGKEGAIVAVSADGRRGKGPKKTTVKQNFGWYGMYEVC
jgi:hypothetical protein